MVPFLYLLHKLHVPENKVVKKILRPKKVEVSMEWRMLYNKELHNLQRSFNIVCCYISQINNELDAQLRCGKQVMQKNFGGGKTLGM
jgi:hypothetical protein